MSESDRQDGPYKGLRGFGGTWSNGGWRNWWIDQDGFKRFVDNDQLVEEEKPAPPPP